MDFSFAKLIFYMINSSWLIVVIHSLEIGPPCDNRAGLPGCTLPDGMRGIIGVLCSIPPTNEADVWCHNKFQHTFALYYCCEVANGVGGGAAAAGLETEPGEFPYMAALGWYTLDHVLDYDFKCGGVMISNTFALTAAHCANIEGDEPIMVFPGGHHLRDNSATTYTIDKVFEHPDYDPDFVYNDIALIKLYGKYTGPVLELWRRPYIANTNFTAIGYGDTTFGGTSSDDLLKVFLQLVVNNDCQRYYKPDFEIPQGVIGSQICAKDSKNIMDTCQGDSGGPLIMTVYGNGGVTKEYLVGITSFGQGCVLSPPGVYTRVSAYIDWIKNITGPYQEVKETMPNRNGCRLYWT